MVARLDTVDPGWQQRRGTGAAHPVLAEWPNSLAVGYGVGATLFLIAVVLLVLIWRGNLHPSILDERPRI